MEKDGNVFLSLYDFKEKFKTNPKVGRLLYDELAIGKDVLRSIGMYMGEFTPLIAKISNHNPSLTCTYDGFSSLYVKLSNAEINHLSRMENQQSLEIKPRYLHDEERRNSLCEAIIQCVKKSREIPEEWVVEFNELCNKLKDGGQ